jgi:hypothetical protein
VTKTSYTPQVVEQLQTWAEKVFEEQVEKIEQAVGQVAQKHLKLVDPTGERHRAQQIVRVAEEIGAGSSSWAVEGAEACAGL